MNSSKLSLPGVILAGGASRRFGSHKAEALLGDRTLMSHAQSRLEQQLSGPIAINVNTTIAAETGAAHIRDALIGDFGPIVGVLTAMKWARSENYKQVLTIAVDTPFFPTNLADRLAEQGAPAVACVGDRLHPVFALWETRAFAQLEAEIRDGLRAMHHWATTCSAHKVDFSDAGPDAFFNINTRDDLEQAERLLARRGSV